MQLRPKITLLLATLSEAEAKEVALTCLASLEPQTAVDAIDEFLEVTAGEMRDKVFAVIDSHKK